MPVLIVSAYADRSANIRLAIGAGTADVFGSREEFKIVDAVGKVDFPELVARIEAVVGHLQALDDIELNPNEAAGPLSDWQVRGLRVFARSLGGQSVDYWAPLEKGLSGATTFLARVSDSDGAECAAIVAKFGAVTDLVAERERLLRDVQPRLRAGTYAPCLGEVLFGTGSYGGLFLKWAEGFDDTLFAVMRKRPGDLPAIVEALRVSMEPWLRNAPRKTVSIGELRRLAVSDEDLASWAPDLEALGQTAFEARRLLITEALQHGDLHGQNILVGDRGPQLIDFARVAKASSSLDPVMLELSLAFHPAAADLRGSWPTVDQARSWSDLDAFALSSPFPEFVRACRAWALRVGSRRNALVNAYCYVMWQLKHSRGQPERAFALIRGVVDAFDA